MRFTDLLFGDTSALQGRPRKLKGQPRALPSLNQPEDFRAQFPDVEPEYGYVIAPYNQKSGAHTPLLVQGFLGVYDGREEDYWCPEVRFTIPPEHFKRSLPEVIATAAEDIAKAEAKLAERRQLVADWEALATRPSEPTE